MSCGMRVCVLCVCLNIYICTDSEGEEENCKKETKRRMGWRGRRRREENGSQGDKNIPDIVE